LLLDLVFFSEVYKLDALEVSSVFVVDFLLDQLFQPLRVGEEPEVLDDLELLLLGVF